MRSAGSIGRLQPHSARVEAGSSCGSERSDSARCIAMQNIIIEKPYQFLPPYRGTFWSSLIKRLNLHAIWLKRCQGVESYELRHVDRLRASLADGHGILLAPNHCRYADPLALGWLAKEVRCHVYAMASWHLFHQGAFFSWAIRNMGAFSVYREGVDRQAIQTAIEILTTAERPLIIFPEGALTRTNDHLHALLDGVAFIARTAAKRRAVASPPGKVVIHPVALKYLFRGDLDEAADGVLTDIEKRLSWRPQRHLSTPDRIAKVGYALLALKEMEYFDRTFADPLAQRLERLIDRLLGPWEEEWFGKVQSGRVVPRVKALRMKILPDMVAGRIDEAERQRRWHQLEDIYLAQQISCYPPDYLASRPTVDRLLETIERYEEDLMGKPRVHGHLHVVIDVGEAIEVPTTRERGRKPDPLMATLEERLQGMLDALAGESKEV